MKSNQKVRDFRQRHFFHRDSAVKPSQIYTDKVFIEKSLRVGIELETSNIRLDCREVEAILRATRSYSDVNSFVHRVYRDYLILRAHSREHPAKPPFAITAFRFSGARYRNGDA